MNQRLVGFLEAVIILALIITLVIWSGGCSHDGNSDIKLLKIPPGWEELEQDKLELVNEEAADLWENEPEGKNYFDYIFEPEDETYANTLVAHALVEGWLYTEQAVIQKIFFEFIPEGSIPSDDSLQEAEICVAALNESFTEGKVLEELEHESVDSEGNDLYTRIDEIEATAEKMKYGGASVHITFSGEKRFPGEGVEYGSAELLYMFRGEYVYFISISRDDAESPVEIPQELVDHYIEYVSFNK